MLPLVELLEAITELLIRIPDFEISNIILILIITTWTRGSRPDRPLPVYS